MKNIKLSIIICTYKREKYVLKNIDLLNKKCRDFIYKVFVIDNGQTLDAVLSNGFINIIPNKNLGGSGGYARGMYEAHKEGNSTHIMLMDDDIEFDTTVLKTAIKKLSNFDKNDYKDWIGFGMVEFERPDVIYECGAYWNGFKAISNNHNLRLSSVEKLNDSLRYNYSGWWSIIMPISVIDDYGYPLPFFLKHDDVEYGLRRKNVDIHFYKELYIKHASFKSKYNPKIDFFNMRNSLIANIFYFKHSFFIGIVKYILKNAKLYFYGGFDGIKMSTIGLNSFLLKKDIMIDNFEINNYSLKHTNKIYNLLILPIIVVYTAFKFIFKYHSAKKYYIKKCVFYKSPQYWEKFF